MAIASTLSNYLTTMGTSYDVVQHRPTMTSMEAALSAQVPGDQYAKSVLLEDDTGYVMAVIPATHRVKISKVGKILDRHLNLADEWELKDLFVDCKLGAIPATGPAYGVETIWDDSLAEQSDVYFDAGDHEEMVHISGLGFKELMGDTMHGHISSHI